MNDEFMLTTINNPFNPFTEFENWINFDISSGTNCCGILSRMAQCSNALSDELNSVEIERAMDTLVELMPTWFVKLHKSNADEVIKTFQSELQATAELWNNSKHSAS